MKSLRRPAERSSRLIQATAAVATLAVVTVLVTYPQAFHLSNLIGQHGDALFSVWRLAWVAHALAAAPARLFDANIFYPEVRTLAYSDAILLPAVVAAPLQWAHVAPVVVYNIVLLGAFFLSAFAVCGLVRSLTSSWFNGVIVGIAFAFSSHQLEHYERLEIQLAFWMPLALWALHRTAMSGRVRDGLIVGGLVAAQVYSGIYNGIFLLTYLCVVAPCVVLIQSQRPRSTIVAVCLGAILTIGVTLPYLLPYLQNRVALGDRSLDEIRLYSATYADYLSAHPNNILYGGRFAALGHLERYLFPGILIVVLAAFGIRFRARPMSVAYLIGLVFSVEMSRGLNSPIYSWLHDHVFVFRGLRAPARFGVLAQMSLAILAGFGIDRLSAAMTKVRLRGVLLAVLLIGVVIECRARPPLLSIAPPSKIYAWLRRQQPAPVLELPVPDLKRLDLSNDLAYMVNSTAHWHPLLNGTSGFFPESYAELLELTRTFPDRDALEYLFKRNVRYVLIHERYMSTTTYRTWRSRLATTAGVDLLLTDFEEGHELAAYRLTRPGPK